MPLYELILQFSAENESRIYALPVGQKGDYV